MPNSHPNPATLRLMACVESFAHHEDGAVGHDDWPGLVGILERELALLTQVATEHSALQSHSAEMAARATALRERYHQLSERITTSLQRDRAELASLGDTARRVHSVRQAYT